MLSIMFLSALLQTVDAMITLLMKMTMGNNSPLSVIFKKIVIIPTLESIKHA